MPNTNYLGYVNTSILTIIGIASTMILYQQSNISNSIEAIEKTQAENTAELLRIKTIQDASTASILDISSRLLSLENQTINGLKLWIDQNYVRLPQKK